MVSMRWVLASAAVFSLFAMGCGVGGAQCASDKDCKGSRVCTQGTCVDPGGTGGGAGGGTGGQCGDPNRTGQDTNCGGRVCNAGSYCTLDSSGVTHTCATGCASDANCGPTDHCVRCGGDTIGTCHGCTENYQCPTGCTRGATADDDFCNNVTNGARTQGWNCYSGSTPTLTNCSNEAKNFYCCAP